MKHETEINPMSPADAALIEIVGTLGAIHRLFCRKLPVPRRRPTYDQTKAFTSKLAELRARSEKLSACETLAEAGGAVGRYRDWLAMILDVHFSSEDEAYAAALTAIGFARELFSISRLAAAFPEDAARRARNMTAKCERA
jgi:hypothetical protein